jgi:hypothetical protein
MKIVIATPFYEVKAYSPYIVSLIDSIRLLQEAGIDYDYYELSGDSYVDRAKNSIVHRFLQSDATHLMMVDSDMQWDVNGFARILKAAIAGAEVVGAAYPCKNNWEFYGCVPKYENGQFLGKEIGDMRLLDMYCIPGGFLVYSRAAFERTRPLLKSYINPENNEAILEAFKCNIEASGGRVGEDVYFQLRFKEAGGTVWLEPDVTIRHYGVKAWEGNYHKFLLKQKIEGERAAEIAQSESVEDIASALQELKCE